MQSMAMQESNLNWAGNLRYSAMRLCEPRTIEELQAIVGNSTALKALGTRHSFNGIADCTGTHVSLRSLKMPLQLDVGNGLVTVGAGVQYGELCRILEAHGCALPNLASLPHISIAGACATATHGSGDSLGSLATSVCAVGMVTAAGEYRRFSRAACPDIFGGLVVSLGALGVVTDLTLKTVPRFDVRQCVYEGLPFGEFEANFNEIFSQAYSVSFFTNWRESGFNQLWLKQKESEGVFGAIPREILGAQLAHRDVHPIHYLAPEPCTPQCGVAGPWHERLPHFRMEYTPSSGQELQSEYFVPRSSAVEALAAMRRMGQQIAPLLQVSEVRTIAADVDWMSPCYGRDSVGIHFTWKKDWNGVRALLPAIEEALGAFDVRPHWGKLFTLSPEVLQSRYPKWEAFQSLMPLMDPSGKFRNAFLETFIERPLTLPRRI